MIFLMASLPFELWQTSHDETDTFTQHFDWMFKKKVYSECVSKIDVTWYSLQPNSCTCHFRKKYKRVEPTSTLHIVARLAIDLQSDLTADNVVTINSMLPHPWINRVGGEPDGRRVNRVWNTSMSRRTWVGIVEFLDIFLSLIWS